MRKSCFLAFLSCSVSYKKLIKNLLRDLNDCNKRNNIGCYISCFNYAGQAYVVVDAQASQYLTSENENRVRDKYQLHHLCDTFSRLQFNSYDIIQKM